MPHTATKSNMLSFCAFSVKFGGQKSVAPAAKSGRLQAIHGTTRLPTQFTAQLAPHFKQLLFPASAEIQANFQQTSYVELSFLGVSTSFLL